MSPEQLKALVDLHEQWRAARAKEAFAAALNACQAEMPVIVRDAENSHTRSRYARLDGITHKAKPIYTAHGFALCFSEDDSKTPGFKRIVCDISHREGHCERRWLDLPIDGTGAKGGKSSMNEVQGCISTGSYGQRVLTCRIFNITIADTDLDGGVPPPAFTNPDHDPQAPIERPRANRQQPPAAPAVNAAQLKHVTAEWQAKNPDPDGNLMRQRGAFTEWARKITGRTEHFNPAKISEWTVEDYTACCDALKIPTLEDLQRDSQQ
jgi:hypothetical protein